MRKETARKRCPARAPAEYDGYPMAVPGGQCGDYAGHDGEHTLLHPSGAPWFGKPDSVDPCPAAPKGAHHPECGGSFPMAGRCHRECPTVLRGHAVLAGTYRPSEHA
jgi:hypothetical protein